MQAKEVDLESKNGELEAKINELKKEIDKNHQNIVKNSIEEGKSQETCSLCSEKDIKIQ